MTKELPLPAYDYCMKCSHVFNVLYARGAISVTERVAVIGRVRSLACGVAAAYLDQTDTSPGSSGGSSETSQLGDKKSEVVAS